MESGRPEMASLNTTEFVPGTRIDRHQYPMVRCRSTLLIVATLLIEAPVNAYVSILHACVL